MTKISVFQELKNKVITNKWVEGKSKGFGDAGITLEAILGKERENFELPDYQGIDIPQKKAILLYLLQYQIVIYLKLKELFVNMDIQIVIIQNSRSLIYHYMEIERKNLIIIIFLYM